MCFLPHKYGVCASLRVSWLYGSNEELLDRGLELNDNLQIVLAKHDAIASGSLMPTQVNYLDPQPSEGYSSNIKSTEAEDSCPSSSSKAPVLVANVTRSPIDEEEEKEDDFAQLARRYHKRLYNMLLRLTEITQSNHNMVELLDLDLHFFWFPDGSSWIFWFLFNLSGGLNRNMFLVICAA